MIIDSWLISRPSVDSPPKIAGLAHHLHRFRRSVEEFYARRLPDDFLTHVHKECLNAPVGWWFPRVEATATTQDFRWRRSPQRRNHTRLIVRDFPDDPRRYPHFKGPDLPTLQVLRTQAQEAGVDDALMCVAGMVCETTTAAVVLRAEDVLVIPEAPRLSSVTEELLLAGEISHADLRWGKVEQRPIEMTEITQPHHQLWALNSLHGITPVTLCVGNFL
ncbi:hypothetical protein GSS88_01015 [Corynebacterium sp. 3HC-13]|uniref:aminotransferase class IV n=1 Tax=Corynebacterium poyangense TaxID=2684405 RepID=UPI001CCFB51C|nr:aminotransferase class IV [Corynebacterium poyangense]MBZ8176382.1 hypothetical protein [Corynebacterium poyangense]